MVTYISKVYQLKLEYNPHQTIIYRIPIDQAIHLLLAQSRTGWMSRNFPVMLKFGPSHLQLAVPKERVELIPMDLLQAL